LVNRAFAIVAPLAGATPDCHEEITIAPRSRPDRLPPFVASMARNRRRYCNQ
jgi:hypothetical protein